METTGEEETKLIQLGIEEEGGGKERDLLSDEEGMKLDKSDDTSDDEGEIEAEIQRLEEQLSINAFDYNCHVDLIKLLRQEGKLHRLRKARLKMSELFPLTEELWLDWLKDEIKLAEDVPDRERMYELFEKAVKDYICPDIWLEYAQYSIGGMGSPGGIEKVRTLFERGLSAVGLHMVKGAALWEAYREFELAIMSSLQPVPGDVVTPEQQELLNTQLERINSLFRRQLSVPLMDMDATYEEYSEWTEGAVPKMVSQSYKRSLQQMEIIKPFEEALLLAEAPKLAEYQSYIDCEVKDGDPARIQIIFERALVENCLVPDLWEKYTTYLDRHLKLKDVVLSAHERAVRNCPWTMTLWKNYLLALERHSTDHSTVAYTFEKSLHAGFVQATDYVEIWHTYLDYLRRRVDFSKEWSKELDELRGAFSRSLEYLKDIEDRFSGSEDLSCTIMQIWARIEALHCRNMQKARELWDSIMTKGKAKYANMWLEYYNLERSYGDSLHCRKALHRAVQYTSDYPEHVCEVLLTFERVEGTLEDWDSALLKTESKLSRISEQRARTAEKEANQVKHEEVKAEERRRVKANKKTLKKSHKSKYTAEKRKAEKDNIYEASELPLKRHCGDGDPEGVETEAGQFGLEEPHHKDIGNFGAANRNQQVQPEATRIKHEATQDKWQDNCSVFISNLAFTLQNPEEQLGTIFQTCGTVKQVRPIFSGHGTFRGYCYVQFQDPLAVAEALKLDRQELEGRPMFVSPCIDKKKNQDFKVFKYSPSLEKHKIFISGLPYTCTQQQLEELFKPHGTIKATRLVTNRSGKPKGLAYVEFANEAQASQAVLKMDGMDVQNYTISVAISNPPGRKMETTSGKQYKSMPPQQTHGARGRSRTQIALLPRSLHRQLVPESSAANGTTLEPLAVTQNKPMSNEDFAQMLRKK
ncbi:spliceosome associated factor 3, U4/U6 recycling protein isoform X1 [Alosa pseudoharengus]|uniref:spliceosome associated factor 3, U4/U6 recycling protein isoform X1 n=1 Tax=Alosa pseudoharengus TaxID=34774 RepID=UPI003F899B1C